MGGVNPQPIPPEAVPDVEQDEGAEGVPASPAPAAPRSVGEALAAAEAEREAQLHAERDDVQPPHGDEEVVEEEPVEVRVGSPDELRAFLQGEQPQTAEPRVPFAIREEVVEEPQPEAEVEVEPPVAETGHDLPVEQSEPSPPEVTHAPTMGDLKRLLTADPEFAATYSTPESEFGPIIEYGERRIPLSLLRMMQAGVIRGFE